MASNFVDSRWRAAAMEFAGTLLLVQKDVSSCASCARQGARIPPLVSQQGVTHSGKPEENQMGKYLHVDYSRKRGNGTLFCFRRFTPTWIRNETGCKIFATKKIYNEFATI